jgi:hypothetical protein
MTSKKNMTSFSYLELLPEPHVARLFSADLFHSPVNKTLFYGDINSRAPQLCRNIYKRAGTHNFRTTRLQIKGRSLISPQQARFHSGCHVTALQAYVTEEHCPHHSDAWFIHVLFANIIFSMIVSHDCR